MIRINRITIENFQSHQNTKLDFEKGLNVIVGPSDHGKSAVIRAIKWVLYNEPRGMDFIRQGASSAKVSMEFSNGYTIIRERSKSKNRYTIVNPDGEETNFEGFGNDVPEEVIMVHKIPRVMLDNDISTTLNISDQLEGPFLLSQTGSVRAKAIGRITGTHILDMAIRNCISDVRKDNQTSERLKNEIEAVDQKLKSYESLDELENIILKSQTAIKELEKLINMKHNIEVLGTKLERLQDEITENLLIIEKTANLKDCEIYIRDCQDKYSSVKTMMRLNVQNKEVGSEILRSEAVMSRTKNIDNIDYILKELSKRVEVKNNFEKVSHSFDMCNKEYQRTQNMVKRFSSIVGCEDIIAKILHKSEEIKKLGETKEKYIALNNKYTEVKNKINEGNNFIKDSSLNIKKLSDEYISILKSLGRCPLCDSKIDDMKLAEIIRHHEEV